MRERAERGVIGTDEERAGSEEASGATERPEHAPLTWEVGAIQVLIAENNREELHEIDVQGPVSGPFGVFRGDGRGLRLMVSPSSRSFTSPPASS